MWLFQYDHDLSKSLVYLKISLTFLNCTCSFASSCNPTYFLECSTLNFLETGWFGCRGCDTNTTFSKLIRFDEFLDMAKAPLKSPCLSFSLNLCELSMSIEGVVVTGALFRVATKSERKGIRLPFRSNNFAETVVKSPKIFNFFNCPGCPFNTSFIRLRS